jgi:hypothetical protein
VPDLDDLDHFDQGLPRMDLLPPSEIRRRGNRLRHRRTALVAGGAVLAAAVAIGTPVLALSGDGGGHGRGVDPPLATQPTPVTWVTTIPDDFPLTDGFADPTATPNDQLAEDGNLTVSCGPDGFAGYTDNEVVAHQGDSEDREVRILTVYADEAAAEAQLAVIRGAVDGCGPFPVKGGNRTWQSVDADLGTEETFAFAEQVEHRDGLVSDLSTFLLGRTGNAIYVDSSYGAAGGDDVLAAEVARLTEASAGPVAALCAFAADGC